VEEHGTAEQATDDNVIRRICFACWVSKGTDTHSECVIIYCFPTATIVTRMCHDVMCIRTLPILLHVIETNMCFRMLARSNFIPH